jgi:hypothetical protein
MPQKGVKSFVCMQIREEAARVDEVWRSKRLDQLHFEPSTSTPFCSSRSHFTLKPPHRIIFFVAAAQDFVGRSNSDHNIVNPNH